MPEPERREFFRNIGIIAGMGVAAGSAVFWKRGSDIYDRCVATLRAQIPEGVSEEQRSAQRLSNAQECSKEFSGTTFIITPVLGTAVYFAVQGMGPTRARSRREFLVRAGITTGAAIGAVVAQSALEK